MTWGRSWPSGGSTAGPGQTTTQRSRSLYILAKSTFFTDLAKASEFRGTRVTEIWVQTLTGAAMLGQDFFHFVTMVPTSAMAPRPGSRVLLWPCRWADHPLTPAQRPLGVCPPRAQCPGQDRPEPDPLSPIRDNHAPRTGPGMVTAATLNFIRAALPPGRILGTLPNNSRRGRNYHFHFPGEPEQLQEEVPLPFPR